MARKKKEEEKIDLDAIVSSIKNKYKDNVVDPNQKVNKIKTGSPLLNYRLEGGIPEGRITEIFGEESSGKTVIALSAIAQAQKVNRVCAVIDMEGSIDFKYLRFAGVDTDKLILLNLESAEKVFDTMRDLFDTGVDWILLDSVAAMPSEAELENEISKEQMGVLARIISKALRTINAPYCKAKGKTIILINQTRENIGAYGDPNKPTGGKAIKFYSSLRLRVNGKKEKGIQHAKCYIAKSRVCTPFTDCLILINDDGLNAELDIFNMALDFGVIEKNGAIYEFDGIKIRGKDNFVNELKTNKKFKDAIIKAGMFEDYVA